MSLDGRDTINTILRHESKRDSCKIALVRAINDIALEYPTLPTHADIANIFRSETRERFGTEGKTNLKTCTTQSIKQLIRSMAEA